MTTLEEFMYDYLEARAVLPQQATMRGYAALHKGEGARYGFKDFTEGILIPLHPVTGAQKYQVRVWKPTGKRKFVTPEGQANCLATVPGTPQAFGVGGDGPVIVAEGITRIDALAGIGVHGLGLTGVHSWRGMNEDIGGVTALPDWNDLRLDVPFWLAPDGDVYTNDKVNQSMRELAAYLRRRGAPDVRVLAAGDYGLGLDDWIAAERLSGSTDCEIRDMLPMMARSFDDLPLPRAMRERAARLSPESARDAYRERNPRARVASRTTIVRPKPIRRSFDEPRAAVRAPLVNNTVDDGDMTDDELMALMCEHYTLLEFGRPSYDTWDEYYDVTPGARAYYEERAGVV